MYRVIPFIAFLSLLFPVNALAQDSEAAHGTIRKLSDHLQSLENLQADFTFTLYYPEDDFRDTQEGKLVLSGEKYRLTLMSMLVLCNGEALWSINEDVKEVYLMEPDENELFNPADIFTLVKNDFRYEWAGKNGSVTTVDLFPMDPDTEYTKIRMEINTAKQQIREVTYFSIDGNQYIIGITSFLTNVKLDNRFFQYDPDQYPGYNLFDMR